MGGRNQTKPIWPTDTKESFKHLLQQARFMFQVQMEHKKQ